MLTNVLIFLWVLNNNTKKLKRNDDLKKKRKVSIKNVIFYDTNCDYNDDFFLTAPNLR